MATATQSCLGRRTSTFRGDPMMNSVFIAKATGTAIRVSGGASLELVESEGCSPVSVVGLVRQLSYPL